MRLERGERGERENRCMNVIHACLDVSDVRMYVRMYMVSVCVAVCKHVCFHLFRFSLSFSFSLSLSLSLSIHLSHPFALIYVCVCVFLTISPVRALSLSFSFHFCLYLAQAERLRRVVDEKNRLNFEMRGEDDSKAKQMKYGSFLLVSLSCSTSRSFALVFSLFVLCFFAFFPF